MVKNELNVKIINYQKKFNKIDNNINLVVWLKIYCVCLIFYFIQQISERKKLKFLLLSLCNIHSPYCILFTKNLELWYKIAPIIVQYQYNTCYHREY